MDMPGEILSDSFQVLHSCSMHAGMIARSGKIGANVTEWKLVDVLELGYSTTDKPFPRGELHIKTKALIPGYYKQQKVSLRSPPSAAVTKRAGMAGRWATCGPAEHNGCKKREQLWVAIWSLRETKATTVPKIRLLGTSMQ